MNYSILGFTFKILLIFILAAFFNSNALAGDNAKFKSGDESEPKQHQVKHRQKKGGPPAHAPAHGYRAKRQYRYYPDQKVYHDPERGLYFYLKGDNWEVGASLPSPLRSALGDSVTIELETDMPYIHNAEHVKKYPSEEPRKSKNNFWSKLLIILLYEHPSK